MLIDKFGRQITYVRLSVTDRCNLRCMYCMPAEGVEYVPRKDLLSYEELSRLTKILCALGITKLRITGGEPFIRKDLMSFIRQLTTCTNIKNISITTNGLVLRPYLDELKDLGIKGLNISIDALDRELYQKITRRDEFDNVMQTLRQAIDKDFKVKVNAVVMAGINENQLIPLAQLARENPIEMRFIEEMPFNGSGQQAGEIKWNAEKIVGHLMSHFPDLNRDDMLPGETSFGLSSPHFAGSLGVIAAYTRTFCGSCNRLRISALGKVKTCLYGGDTLDLQHLFRNGASDEEIKKALQEAVLGKPKDGFEAEKIELATGKGKSSMSAIGG